MARTNLAYPAYMTVDFWTDLIAKFTEHDTALDSLDGGTGGAVPLTADAAGRAKMADDFFSTASILAGKFSDGVFDATAAVRALFADKFLPAAKANLFVSAEQTGTGSAQNVAHGLTGTPSIVLVIPTEHPGTPDTGAFDIAEGTHTGTNVVLTVTPNVKFKVFAWV